MKNYLLYEEEIILEKKSEFSEYHVVDKDESFHDIARKYYGNPDLWEIIMRYNGYTDSDKLVEGTQLEIPPM